MQHACTTATRAVTEEVALEPPVSLGGKLKNVGFGGFSKTRTIVFGRGVAVDGERLNSLQATTDGGCGVFDGLHRTEHDRRSVFP